MRCYLDWNATAPLRSEARAAMTEALDLVGNPSSVHEEGRRARHLLDDAREKVAALIGATARNVVFTSGGSEANVLALTPDIADGQDRRPREHLLISAIEHASVRAGGRFKPEQVHEIPVTANGEVDLSALRDLVATLGARGARFLVSVMHANNETGVVQPIRDIADIVHAAGGLLHVDAVQSVGKIPCDIAALGADLLSLSAHKIGGPKGVGALVKARDALHIAALINGGGQERGARAGTENVSGIAGFGAAAEAAAGDLARFGDLATRRAELERSLVALHAGTVIFGGTQTRLPNTTLFAVSGIKAETALIALDLDGVAVSSGSACSSGKVAASHVLKAMGVASDLAAGAIRVSIGPSTTSQELEYFLKAWEKRVSALSNREKRGLAA